jgi:thiazolinyl imide reductase
VCGTTFGQVYLEGLRGSGGRFVLAGILAHGSDRSRACAEHYGVPLFGAVDELPADIDIACVVVRGALLGGRGTELARQLMSRGIHVLQEQPVHHDEVADCLRVAGRHGVCYRLNSFYRHLPATRRFIELAGMLLRQRRALYLDAACCIQVGFPLLDVLFAMLQKTRPWRFEHAPSSGALCELGRQRPLFQQLHGLFGGVWTTLRVQNQIHPSDPDDYAHLLHRITLGTDAGDLLLTSSHGPIVWSARPEIPREVRDADSQRLFAHSSLERSSVCTEILSSTAGASQRALFQSDWPQAVRHALGELVASIESPKDALREGQNQLALCRAWQDVVDALGLPQLIPDDAPPRGLSDEEFAGLRAAGRASAVDRGIA